MLYNINVLFSIFYHVLNLLQEKHLIDLFYQ